MHILDQMSLISSSNTKVAEKSSIENQDPHFIIIIIIINFSENRVVYEVKWKIFLQPDRPQITPWRMRIACWISRLQKHTQKM